MGESSAKIETRELDAYFGSNKAVKGINIKVKANHATAIIGPSGCGKSTVHQMLE